MGRRPRREVPNDGFDVDPATGTVEPVRRGDKLPQPGEENAPDPESR
jgi:hypothetical protein